MKLNHYLSICLLLLSNSIFSQNEEMSWLKNNVYKLSDIEPMKDNDSELDFLKKVIGEKNIVLLGEEGHYDGQTLKAKSKIIKYLHQEMGFEVLLIEKGIYEVDRAWRDLLEERDKPLHIFADLTKILGITVDNEYKDLYEYIAKKSKTDKPLQLGGFDITESSTFVWGLEYDLNLLFEKYVDNYYKDSLAAHVINGTTGYSGEYSSIKEKSGLKSKKIILKRLIIIQKQNKLNTEAYRQLAFMIQCLKSKINALKAHKRKKARKKYKKKGIITADYFTMRDKFMAKNLLWYINYYFKGKKIIISASSYHISRNVDIIDPRPYFLGEDAIPMGDYIWEELSNQMYSIAFLSYKGKRGIGGLPPQNKKIKKRCKKGLEQKLHRLGIKFGFLDLKKLPKNIKWFKSFYMSATFNESYKTDWSKIFDGIFFIDEMKPPDSYYLKGKAIKNPYLPSNYVDPASPLARPLQKGNKK